MPGRIFRIRLPEDHWLWSVPRSERSIKVQQALEFYNNIAGVIEDMRLTLDELREEVKNAGLKSEKENVNKRMRNSINNLLEV